MKKIHFFLILMSMATIARAQDREDIVKRCERDPLEDHLLEGRLLWLLNCNFITHNKMMTHLDDREYPTYSIPGSNDQSAPCYPLGKRQGTCVAVGCYAPGQRLLFGGKYVAIDDAYEQGLKAVSTLGSADLIRPLYLKETPIASFIEGDAHEELIALETEGGSQLKVTKSHPFFDDSGLLVIANKLQAGATRILTLRGPELVTSVQREEYEGKVWNIKPNSTNYSDNVVIAEDILTGSIRFQNQWADLKEKFLHRDGRPLDD